MIHELSGDILLSKAAVIAHGVAPDDHFDQGLALGLRERWPALARDFRHYCHDQSPKPGAIFPWVGTDAGGAVVRVVNLMTQAPAAHPSSHPGRASISHVDHALKALARWLRQEGCTSIALPRLATGVGGLEWQDVRRSIVEHLGDLGIPVYVYTTYRAGVAAVEPGQA